MEKGESFCTVVRMQISVATVESSMQILQKIKMDLLFDPAIPLLGINPNKSKMLIQKNISTPVFIAVLLTIAKIWKQPECPSVD